MTKSVCSYIQSPQEILGNSKNELNIFEITTIQVDQLNSLLSRINQVAQQNLETSLDNVHKTFKYLDDENFEEKLDQKDVKQFCGDYPSEFANNLEKLHEGVIQLDNQRKQLLLFADFAVWLNNGLMKLSQKNF